MEATILKVATFNSPAPSINSTRKISKPSTYLIILIDQIIVLLRRNWQA